MLIRTERPGDSSAISEVLSEAFRRPEAPDERPVEVGLVEELRRSSAWIPQLSLVAVVDGRVVGHCVCTRGRVGAVPVLALGPIGVAIHAQRRGVGTALMDSTIEIATDMGDSLICLLGDNRYYVRFGFRPGFELGVEAPDPSWGRNFQVRKLPGYESSIKGPFAYPEPFQSIP